MIIPPITISALLQVKTKVVIKLCYNVNNYHFAGPKQQPCMCDKQPLMNIVSISNSISVSAWGTENPYINFVLLC